MARLPQVGGDQGNWGEVLNDFLRQSHAENGLLKSAAVDTAQLAINAVTTTAIADNQITTAKLINGSVTPEKIGRLGQSSGVASLDTTGRLPEAQLPSRLDASALSSTITSTAGAIVDTKLSETILDVKRFGLRGDGATDNTAALNALVASLPVVGSGAHQTIYFPAGTYVFSGSVVFTRTVTVRGDGENATRIERSNGASGDLFTFKANNSTIRDLSINGNGSRTTGDDIVFDSSYARAQNLYLVYSGGTAIRVGKATRSLAHRIDQILVRAPRDYCAYVTDASNGGSTDGIWSNCDFGTAGLSAMRVESSSLNMTNIHTWGSGTRLDDTDGSGFMMVSSGHLMATCQAETNWVHGFHFKDSNLNGSIVSASKSWANGLSGFAATRYHRLTLDGWSAYNNGLRNPNGSSASDLYAGIRNEESNHLTVVGGRAFDRSVSMDVSAPSPVMSKGAYVTQVYDYAESLSGTAPSFGIFTGNNFTTTNGISMRTNAHVWGDNRTPTTPSTLAAANTLPLRSHHEVVTITGSTTIITIAAATLGRTTTLKFSDPCAVGVSGNIVLASAFTATAGSYLTLRFDGTNWIEQSRIIA